MGETMEDEHLRKARDELRAYAETSQCGWCKKKAEQIATAAEDLETAMPDAERLRQAVSKTRALSNLDSISSELRQQRERSDRLIEHVESITRDVAPARPPAPPPSPQPRAAPLGPRLVTPDDIAKRDAELYKKYKSIARPRGPIRDRVAFRVFKRTDKE